MIGNDTENTLFNEMLQEGCRSGQRNSKNTKMFVGNCRKNFSVAGIFVGLLVGGGFSATFGCDKGEGRKGGSLDVGGSRKKELGG